jgi:very-short-patch-repair endonuclease/predicted transcriptional regulator of viral defense system
MTPNPAASSLTFSTADAAIDRLAAGQHGVVTRAQLVVAGVGPSVVDHRLRTGRITAMHHGVYRVGPLRSTRAAEMAACLACGPLALVSHQSGGVLWRILPEKLRPDPVEVTLTGGNRRRPGVRIHRVPTLAADEATRLDGIPVTTPERTLLDLATAVGRRTLERALAEAIALRLTSPPSMEALLDRHAGRPGSARLRTVLEGGQPALTRSEAEEVFLNLIRKAGLGRPRVNTRLGGFEVDFYWPPERLVVEIDGFPFHSSRQAFERDRRRDAEFAALGLRVVRVTWRQLDREREALLVRLTRALDASGRSGRSGRAAG